MNAHHGYIDGLQEHYLSYSEFMFSLAFTCHECSSWIDGLQEHYLSHSELQNQSDVLVSTLCPTADDPNGCTNGFRN